MTDPTGESDVPGIDPSYVEACRVLLDALVALAPQGAAFIVAGAQAIYLRTGEADIAVAPYTTDGDLTLDPVAVGTTLATLSGDGVAGPVTVDALMYIEQLFGKRGARGTEMAVRALRVGMPEARVEALCVGYTGRLLGAARG